MTKGLVMQPAPPENIQVIAHRGASRVERENTLAAYHAAARLGAHAVELDVRRTADGALVVHHDAHLPDGRLLVEIDVTEVPTEVPSLAAALDACAGMWVNVEIKNSVGDPDHDPTQIVARGVMQELHARGESQRWLISSFDMATIDRCRAIDPTVRTAFLCVEPPAGIADQLVRAGHAALHPWFGCATDDVIAACHAAGVQVNVWTVDEPTDLETLARRGVDGLCTNVPDVALKVLRSLL
jgi:glycerophosphoryl diester phosphodiesterase